MQLKKMRLAEAKRYVADKLGVGEFDLSDSTVMRTLREELDIGVVTAVPGLAKGLEAKARIADLLDIMDQLGRAAQGEDRTRQAVAPRGAVTARRATRPQERPAGGEPTGMGPACRTTSARRPEPGCVHRGRPRRHPRGDARGARGRGDGLRRIVAESDRAGHRLSRGCGDAGEGRGGRAPQAPAPLTSVPALVGRRHGSVARVYSSSRRSTLPARWPSAPRDRARVGAGSRPPARSTAPARSAVV